MTAEIGFQPFEAVHGAYVVTLRHDRKLNAMSRAMWKQLRSVFQELAKIDSARCIVIQGQGGAFCAGGDISEYPDFRFSSAGLRDFHENDVWGALQAVLSCEVPVVACIEGACMGAGVEIASCCDIRLASTDARFGAPIAKLGFPMAPRELRLVAGAVGESIARQMLLEARIFDAEEMLRSGFVGHLVGTGDLPQKKLEMVRRIAGLAPQAARMNKKFLRIMKDGLSGIDCGLDPYAYADSFEHVEGVMAFLEKRKPEF